MNKVTEAQLHDLQLTHERAQYELQQAHFNVLMAERNKMDAIIAVQRSQMNLQLAQRDAAVEGK